MRACSRSATCEAKHDKYAVTPEAIAMFRKLRHGCRGLGLESSSAAVRIITSSIDEVEENSDGPIYGTRCFEAVSSSVLPTKVAVGCMVNWHNTRMTPNAPLGSNSSEQHTSLRCVFEAGVQMICTPRLGLPNCS